MPATPKGLVTVLMLVRMAVARIGNHEALRAGKRWNRACGIEGRPMQRPPRYWLNLAVPDPVAGSNEVVVLTLVL